MKDKVAGNKNPAVVYDDGRYTLGLDDGKPYLSVGENTYSLSCQPYEPCLYIKGENGGFTVVHNAFDPYDELEAFSKNEALLSVTGYEYNALDFCRMVEYASRFADISIDCAEKIFDKSIKNGQTAKESGVILQKTTVFEENRVICDADFDEVINGYPDCVIDFCLVKNDNSAKGYDAHRSALFQACRRIMADEWVYDTDKAKAEKIDADVLFARINEAGELNYRHAFLHPPYETNYTDADFERVNEALFPNGTKELEAYEWTTDWSDYFDEGHEWWGAFCYTVYDKGLDRFAVILASATD